FSIVQAFICGHALWTARQLFAILPIENCIVHMTERSIDKATGHPKKRVQLSVKYEREIVDQLNVQQLDPYQALENFEHHVDFIVNKRFRSVKKLSYSGKAATIFNHKRRGLPSSENPLLKTTPMSSLNEHSLLLITLFANSNEHILF